MRRIAICGIIVFSIMMTACSKEPTIDEVEQSSADAVERLLTEDNNEDLYLRLDRFFLDEHPDKLTYTGTLKATAFYKNKLGKWDSSRVRWVATTDSLKLYRSVEIKFRDN